MLFLSCTAMASLTVVQALERDCGKPVITSNLASAWGVMRMLGLREPMPWNCRLAPLHLRRP